MRKAMQIVCAAAVVVGLGSVALAKTNIETVPVGNVGNAGDVQPNGTFGSVDYKYNIGKYEVTAGQYREFLNAMAKTDPYGLFRDRMDSNSYGCQITRNGTSGNYTYDFSGGVFEAPASTASDWENRPVNYVSWGDAARFANWLHNGQPTGAQGPGTTEDGAYDLSGTHEYYGPEGEILDLNGLQIALNNVTRNSGWKWAITSEDEWYKAAYHKNDGVTGNYYDYPTASDASPSNEVVDPDPGNHATFWAAGRSGGYTIGGPYWQTEAGTHENSVSPYDTLDQGGNVWEWNETVIYGSARALRSGSFSSSPSYMRSSLQYNRPVAYEYHNIGFRVSEVPEPATMSLLALGGLAVLRRRSRGQRRLVRRR